MKNTINWLLVLCSGLILIGCNSGGGSSTSANPTVQIISPTNDATGVLFNSSDVALNSKVTLQFSGQVKGVNNSTLTWSSDSGSVPFNLESGANNTYTLSLKSGVFLDPDTVYNVTVKHGITANVNNNEVSPATFSFITAKPPTPTVSLTSPNPTTYVSITPTITLTFSESVFGVTTKTIQVQSQSGVPESATIIANANNYTLKLNKPLLYITGYVVVVKTGLRSLATLAPILPTTFNFTTTPQAPTVSLTSPNPTTYVGPNPTIILTFSEAVANINTTTIQLQTLGGLPQVITISPSGNNSYTLNLSESLLLSTQYVVQVNSGISSVATGVPVAPTQFGFRTAFLGLLTALSPPTISTGPVPYGITISPDGLNVYVTSLFGSLISQYSRNISTGTLTAIGSIVEPGYVVSGITISPDGNNVYVTGNVTGLTNGFIFQYSRSESGGLTAIGTVATNLQPEPIIVSPDGLNVYVAHVNSFVLTQYSRSESGRLTALGSIATLRSANGIILSPDGNNVYATITGARLVSQYSRNISTGILTEIGNVATENAPYGLTISPDGKNVYVANRTSNTISQYNRSESGRLTALIPAIVAAGNAPTRISISPDGANVYVTNQFSNTVSQYSRNQATGLLTALGAPVATEQPTEISISPDGVNVYVANDAGSSVSQYSR